jgi:uncharacterized protein (TIGR00730 family)
LIYNDICVFCASTEKVKPEFLEAAECLGRAIAKAGKRIIYGGGKVGLMGHLADKALEANGIVRGIIPKFLMGLELGHSDIAELIEVEDMHARDAMMMKEADAIIVLPGGIGTFSELLQAITWNRLNQISAPIIIINTNNYFDPIIKMLDSAIEENFLRAEFRPIWQAVNSVDEALGLIGAEIDDPCPQSQSI